MPPPHGPHSRPGSRSERGRSSFDPNDVPFKIDVTSPEDLDDLLNDPEVLEIFSDLKNLTILTPEILLEMRGDLSEGLQAKLNGTSDEDVTEQELDEMLEVIKERYPKFYEHIEEGIQKQAEKGRDMDRGAEEHHREQGTEPPDFKWEDSFRRSAKGSAASIFFSDSEGFAMYLEGEYFLIFEQLPPVSFFYTGDMNRSKEDLVQQFGGFEDGEIDLSEAPGSIEHWNAYVFFHELEHVADRGQRPLQQYFEKLEDRVQGFGLSDNAAHAREIEADLAAHEALKDHVPAEVFDYMIACRVASGSDHHFESIWQTGIWDVEDLKEDFDFQDVAESHETGYFWKEYSETGTMPDYLAQTTAMNNFHAKATVYVVEKLYDRVHENNFYHDSDYYNNLPMEQRFKMNFFDPNVLTDFGPPSHGVMVEAIQEMLMADPPVLDPAEQQIAQMYLDSVVNELGIEPESLDEYLDNAVEQVQEAHEVKQERQRQRELERQQELEAENPGEPEAKAEPETGPALQSPTVSV